MLKLAVSASGSARGNRCSRPNGGYLVSQPCPNFSMFHLRVWCFWWSSFSLSVFGGPALWGYSKTALRWIFYQSPVFLFKRWLNISIKHLLLVYNLNNNSSWNHPNLRLHWVSLGLYWVYMYRLYWVCRWGPLNLMISGAGFHDVLTNTNISFNKTVSQFKKSTCTADVTLSVSIHWKCCSICNQYYNSCCISF